MSSSDKDIGTYETKNYYTFCQQDTKEYELPKNMPVTSRMMHKAGRSSSEPVWMTVRQGALPPLPALKRSDSYLTMAESVSGNASQLSFMVE